MSWLHKSSRCTASFASHASRDRHAGRSGPAGVGLSHVVVVGAAPWAATGAWNVRAGDAGRRQAPHDLRCEARGGEFGVRVNMVNPDAVFDGSGLWSKEIRKARAKVYGVPVQQLENFCAGRNLLKVRVLDHWSCDPRRWGSAGSVPQMRDLRKIACGVHCACAPERSGAQVRRLRR